MQKGLAHAGDFASTKFFLCYKSVNAGPDDTETPPLISFCGYCYTQLSDVQQEINGIMDEDRNFKIDPAVLREIV
jgi:hypothetical protein